jgi:hypothetical protein
MDGESTTTTEETTRKEQMTVESDTSREYNLPVELFAGIVILIMGSLVLVTPLFADMPTNLVWDPVFVNVSSGILYLIVGAIFVYRSDYI